MEEGKLKDNCPACGVSKKMFEPYTPDISPKRAFILDAHLHPVIVHVPQAFTFITLLAVAVFFFDTPFKGDLLSAIKFMCIILPVATLGSIISGLIDGKIRFRKVTTQILLKKIFYGSVFVIFSSVMTVIVFLFGIGDLPLYVLFLVSNFICFIASIRLGILGASLLNARFPG
jgi:hypothetical protein